MKDLCLRILFSTAANDAFIERVESQLARALIERGHDLLLLVEGREPSDRGIPTIDTQDWADDSSLPARHEELEQELARIIEDSRWYACACGYASDRRAIEHRLVTAAAHVDRIIDDYRPHVVLTWNGLLGVRAVVASRARNVGVPVLYCERGALPGSWCADPCGVNAASSIAVTPLPSHLNLVINSPLADAERNAVLAELRQTAQAGVSAWEQAGLRGADAWRAELGLAANQRVLFFPMQVDADTNMRFFSPHYAGSVTALGAVAQAVRSMPGWFLLVKPHPKGTYPPGAIERAIGENGRCVPGINLHDALLLSSLVVTINSTVACEAVWSGKPVLQLGKGILSGKGIVAEYDSARPLGEQLLQAVELWQQEPDRRDRGLQFYRFLRDYHLMQADSDLDTDRLVARLEGMAVKCCADGGRATARAVCEAHVWEPARCLLERIAARKSLPRNVVVVGFGRNAVKLLEIASRSSCAEGITWSAWDDCPQARDRAAQLGLSIVDPSQASRDARVIFVLTPRHATPLADRMEQWGYHEGCEFERLFRPTLPGDAIAG